MTHSGDACVKLADDGITRQAVLGTDVKVNAIPKTVFLRTALTL